MSPGQQSRPLCLPVALNNSGAVIFYIVDVWVLWGSEK
jgi:hypothetical protein